MCPLADGAQEEVPGVAEEDLALRMERLQMQYVWEQLRLGQMPSPPQHTGLG